MRKSLRGFSKFTAVGYVCAAKAYGGVLFDGRQGNAWVDGLF